MADRKSMPDRRSRQISRAWEHPADRAALHTLRAHSRLRRGRAQGRRRSSASAACGSSSSPTPCASDRGSGRSSTRSTPRCSRRWTGQKRTELYVTQTPIVNAMAVGFDEPFIVINSGLLGAARREEQRTILAHELGHIMSGHTTYTHDRDHPPHHRAEKPSLPRRDRAAAVRARAARVVPQERAVERPRRAALRQDPDSGDDGRAQDGRRRPRRWLRGLGLDDDEIDLDAFIAQAEEYETGGNARSTASSSS